MMSSSFELRDGSQPIFKGLGRSMSFGEGSPYHDELRHVMPAEIIMTLGAKQSRSALLERERAIRSEMSRRSSQRASLGREPVSRSRSASSLSRPARSSSLSRNSSRLALLEGSPHPTNANDHGAAEEVEEGQPRSILATLSRRSREAEQQARHAREATEAAMKAAEIAAEEAHPRSLLTTPLSRMHSENAQAARQNEKAAREKYLAVEHHLHQTSGAWSGGGSNARALSRATSASNLLSARSPDTRQEIRSRQKEADALQESLRARRGEVRAASAASLPRVRTIASLTSHNGGEWRPTEGPPLSRSTLHQLGAPQPSPRSSRPRNALTRSHSVLLQPAYREAEEAAAERMPRVFSRESVVTSRAIYLPGVRVAR